MLYNTANPHGGEIYSRPVEIDFSANINPFGTPPGVLTAAAESLTTVSQYPDPYCRKLVAAIAAHEEVPESCILCGNGAAELIFSLCAALRPQKAMVTAPCFSEYESALRTVGCNVERFQLHSREDFRVTEGLPAYLKDWDGDLLMLCNPNNPTGQTVEPEIMEAIWSVCREKGIFLFVDECFLDLTEGGETLSLKKQLAPGMLLLKAFTKSYGMAGLRLGYCLCADPMLLRRMGNTVQAWNVSIPAQAAGVAALQEREFLARANALIHAERPRVAAELTAMGCRVIPSRTNFLLFQGPENLRDCLLERGLQLRSCDNYPGLGAGWFRTAIKLPEQNDRLLRELEACIHG